MREHSGRVAGHRVAGTGKRGSTLATVTQPVKWSWSIWAEVEAQLEVEVEVEAEVEAEAAAAGAEVGLAYLVVRRCISPSLFPSQINLFWHDSKTESESENYVCVTVRVCVSWVIATHTENALCFVITCLGHMERRRGGETPKKQRQRSLVSVSSHLLFFFLLLLCFVVSQLRSRTNLWKEMKIAFVCFGSRIFQCVAVS